MGFRFRRSLKIFPGIRLNLSKRGFSSITIGGRKSPIKVNVPIGREGPGTITISNPGGIFTGMSYTTNLPETVKTREPPTLSDLPTVSDLREALRLDQERRMQKLLDEQEKRKSS